MADPATLAVVGMGASAGAGIAGAFGSLFGGQAQSDQLSYQAGVAKMNQQIAKQNADYSKYVGEVEAQRVGMEGRSRIGSITAAKGASGVEVGSGSAQDVIGSQLDITQHDEATTRANAARKAYGHEMEGFEQGEQAKLLEKGAKNTKTASYINAASSLLGGASSVASKWSTYKTNFGGKDTDSSGINNWATYEG